MLHRNLPKALAALPDRAAVMVECRAAIAAAAPGAVEGFARAVHRLRLHYPESRLAAEEEAMVLTDWRRLLGHLPADVLEAAVDAYIVTPARFFPSLGQFKEVAEPIGKMREVLARRARVALELMGEADG